MSEVDLAILDFYARNPELGAYIKGLVSGLAMASVIGLYFYEKWYDTIRVANSRPE